MCARVCVCARAPMHVHVRDLLSNFVTSRVLFSTIRFHFSRRRSLPAAVCVHRRYACVSLLEIRLSYLLSVQVEIEGYWKYPGNLVFPHQNHSPSVYNRRLPFSFWFSMFFYTILNTCCHKNQPVSSMHVEKLTKVRDSCLAPSRTKKHSLHSSSNEAK